MLVASGREVSVREVRRALQAGRITVEGCRRAPGDRARGGETVDAEGFTPRAEARIAHDDLLASRIGVLAVWPDLVALDKPPGVPCAPLRPDERGTLAHAAAARFPEVADAGPPLEGGLLHRLDTGTSGVVLFARDLEARRVVRAWFSAHQVNKSYLAVCQECDLPPRVELPIRPGGTRDRVRVGAGPGARPAAAELEVIAAPPAAGPGLAGGRGRMLVRVRTRFGRRHQVRAHLAHLGAPLIGDALYGGPAGDRLMLHAEAVSLPDGREVSAPAPEGFS
jgi:23S rRNA pseudouridine1911/1915/1917 synthase